METALEVEEIRQAICVTATPATLAALARTSSAFFLPAARDLYKHSDDRQLLHMLWCYHPLRRASEDLEGNPDAAALWTMALPRFRCYASMIQTLSLTGYWKSAFRNPRMNPKSATVAQHLLGRLIHISVVAGLRPPFPNLRTFILNPMDSFPMFSLSTILSGPIPTLQTVKLDLSDQLATADIEDILDALPACAPSLRCLHLTGDRMNWVELAPAIQRAISKLDVLEVFVGGNVCLRIGALKWLGNASNLREVQMWRGPLPEDEDSSGLDSLKSLTSTMMFVEKLRLDNLVPPAATLVLDQLSSACLRDVQIRLNLVSRSMPSDDISPILKSIGGFPRLQTLGINARSDRGTDPSLFWTDLDPLFACHQLRKCSLSVTSTSTGDGTHVQLNPCTRCVDDSVIQKMGEAWSSLEELSLHWLYEEQGHPNDIKHGPTLKSLALLLSLCPQLQYLRLDTLHTNASNIPLLEGSHIPRPLRLQVQETAMEDLEDVAIFLVNLTSHLQVIGSCGMNWDSRGSTGTQWSAIVAGMRTARRLYELQNPACGALGLGSLRDSSSWMWPDYAGWAELPSVPGMGWETAETWAPAGWGAVPAAAPP